MIEKLMSNLSCSLAHLNAQSREVKDTGATAEILSHPKAG